MANLYFQVNSDKNDKSKVRCHGSTALCLNYEGLIKINTFWVLIFDDTLIPLKRGYLRISQGLVYKNCSYLKMFLQTGLNLAV